MIADFKPFGHAGGFLSSSRGDDKATHCDPRLSWIGREAGSDKAFADLAGSL
jgi:hypothetical protein